MSVSESASPQGTFEECVDELSEVTGTLDRYSRTVLACALRAHLSGLLQSMLEDGDCSPGDVRAFVTALRTQTLAPEEG